MSVWKYVSKEKPPLGYMVLIRRSRDNFPSVDIHTAWLGYDDDYVWLNGDNAKNLIDFDMWTDIPK